MQQEDDLRGLARVMDFMRAISILFVGINVYWFCYSTLKEWGVTFEVIDKILWNFQRTTGLFSSVLWTKLFSVVFLALSCIGTKGVKEEKITWTKIHCSLATGVVLFFLNWWLLELPLPHTAGTVFYIATLSVGYICMLMAGTWMSRLLKNNLMEDVFNMENESFQQETRLIENEYSVNLPTRFYYNKKWNNGWINVVNPFRASLVLGTPGSGKSYAVVNSYIKQQIEKGFALYCYDYKFPDLSEIAYNQLLNHLDGYKVKPKFYITRALDGVTLSIEKGEFVAIVGTSGSGKSTLLNMIGGLDVPTSGQVVVDGKELSKLKDEELTVFRRRKIGFIFQNYNLVPVLNVFENIVLPVELDGNKVDKKFMNEVVQMLGLEDKLNNMPNNLSGGQQQRVAIARALVSKPAIVLADEPTGNLDSKTSADVLGLLKTTSQKFHQTLVMITHNNEIAQLADRIIRIEDGKIVQ